MTHSTTRVGRKGLALLALPVLAAALYGCGGGGGGSSGGGSSSSSSSASTGFTGGAEVLVNTGTAFDQSRPKAATLNNGNVVVTWVTSLGTVGGIPLSEIRAQIFTPASVKVGSELIVSSDTATSSTSHRHINPTIVALGDGGFAIAYSSNTHTPGLPAGLDLEGPIFVRVYNAAGVPEGPANAPALISTSTGTATATNGTQFFPVLTKLTDGRFLLSWTQQSSPWFSDGDNQSIKGHLYTADGDEIGTSFVINTSTVGQQSNQRVTALSNGGFALSWMDWNGSAGASLVSKLKAQIFDSSGAKSGAELTVNNKAGINQFLGGITSMAGGGFVVAWSEGAAGIYTSDELAAQIYDASGNKVGAEIAVPSNTTNRQVDANLVTLSNGNFAVIWADNSLTLSDTSEFGLKAQVFTPAGAKVGNEFLINAQTSGRQIEPTVTAIAGGGFFAAWSDSSGTLGDADGMSIKARAFTP